MPVPRTGNRPPLRLVHSHGDGGHLGAMADHRPAVLHVLETGEDLLRTVPVRAALEATGHFRQVTVEVEDRRNGAPGRGVPPEFGAPAADRRLSLGGDTTGMRTARAMEGFERVLLEERPAIVLLPGDGDVMLAAALAATTVGVPVVRTDAGLRRRDWTDLRDTNAVLADRVADIVCTQCPEAADNLIAEGCDPARIHYVGSTMVDTVQAWRDVALRRAVWRRWGLDEKSYALVSLSDPATHADRSRAERLVEALVQIARRMPLVVLDLPRVPVSAASWEPLASAGACFPALPAFVDRLALASAACAIVTDRPDVQEQATALGTPCLTLGGSTERLGTLTHGTNVLIGDDPRDLVAILEAHRHVSPGSAPLWDGRAGERIARVLEDNYVLADGAAAPPVRPSLG